MFGIFQKSLLLRQQFLNGEAFVKPVSSLRQKINEVFQLLLIPRQLDNSLIQTAKQRKNKQNKLKCKGECMNWGVEKMWQDKHCRTVYDNFYRIIGSLFFNIYFLSKNLVQFLVHVGGL